MTQSMELMGHAIMQQNNQSARPSQQIGHMIRPTHINYCVHGVHNPEPVHDKDVADNWTYQPL